jgi:predicted acyl esterase
MIHMILLAFTQHTSILKKYTIPTLVVGGWFDAEDLFGALHTYEAIEKQSPSNKNFLVMGPWTHGAWGAAEWKEFGTHQFRN